MNAEYEALIKRLQELPALIAEKEINILRLKNLGIQAQYFMNRRESYIKYVIVTATDKEGKKLYRNEDVRNKETYDRTSTDPEYKELKKKYESLDATKSQEEIDYKKYLHEFSSIKYQIRILELARIAIK